MSNHGDIELKVIEIVADILSLETEEIRSESRFFTDLGGESIDVLDLEFKCKQEFGVQTEFQKIFSSQNLSTAADGSLAPDALYALKEHYPFLPYENLPERITLEDLKELLTIGSITAFVRERLEHPSEKAEPEIQPG